MCRQPIVWSRANSTLISGIEYRLSRYVLPICRHFSMAMPLRRTTLAQPLQVRYNSPLNLQADSVARLPFRFITFCRRWSIYPCRSYSNSNRNVTKAKIVTKRHFSGSDRYGAYRKHHGRTRPACAVWSPCRVARLPTMADTTDGDFPCTRQFWGRLSNVSACSAQLRKGANEVRKMRPSYGTTVRKAGHAN